MLYSDKKYLTHTSMFPFALNLVSLMSKRNNSRVIFMYFYMYLTHYKT